MLANQLWPPRGGRGRGAGACPCWLWCSNPEHHQSNLLSFEKFSENVPTGKNFRNCEWVTVVKIKKQIRTA